MKTIYFVRHGETDKNASKRFNTPDSPLSEKGKKQALEIAARATKLPIALIVASTAKRAQQTAAIVNEKVGTKVDFSSLFVEGSYSSKLYGMEVDHPEATKITEDYFKHFAVPGHRVENGESFEDLKRRALAGFEYLEKRSENNILVISHGFFMWVIAAVAIFGKDLTAEECRGIIQGFDLMENTGLTVITRGAPTRKVVGEPMTKWQLKVWNDHAHLG